MSLFPSFWMQAQWGARVETPEALAERFLRTIDAVQPLNPLFRTWNWGDAQEVWESEGEGGSHPFADIRPNLVRAIERNANTGEEEVPDPFYGYLMLVITENTSQDSGAGISASAGEGINGGSFVSPFMNDAEFKIGSDPDPSLVSYSLFRTIMLILCETWEATWAEACPENLKPEWNGCFPVRCAWMNYVSPRFAPLITPPASAIVEYRPNGGLFLAATDAVFETGNPAHMAVSREIEAALQPLNRLPFPIDDPYWP